VIAHWTREQIIIGSNPGTIEIIFIVLCSRHVFVLHCINNYCKKLHIFRKSIAIHHFKTLY
jgi:hypothetical protein